jgi:chromosome segregation ATPase
MTNEEAERAIDFLLRSQANSEARIEQTNEQLNRLAGTVDQLAGKVVELTEGFDRMNFQLGSYADSQVEFMRAMTEFMESATARQARLEQAHVRLEESQARVNETLAASQARAEESQARINESLRASIGELADAQAQSERSLDRLTIIVEEERGR